MNKPRRRRVRLHVASWLTATAHLDDVQYTALHRLLNHACINGGELPSRRDELAALARCTLEDFDRAWPEIAHWFDVAPDGRITSQDACRGLIAARGAIRA